MSRTAVVPRRIVAVLLGLMAVTQVGAAVVLAPSSAIVAALCGVLAVAAVVTVPVVLVGQRTQDLLAAIGVGAAGVAAFLGSAVIALAAGSPLAGLVGGWPIGAFLVAGLVARLAAVALRREAGT